ncbi:hypothetical protein J2751_002975 [Halorubrum alkaliphilum]|uniref:Uncharacterized protein n=1 Tax=Halorubrum alkaliphilum TaxID=261290 RepID=A0A8T4GJQ3_9EURY|nr:hypothetical protein [Halorubrum alkaliphilum]
MLRSLLSRSALQARKRAVVKTLSTSQSIVS